MRFTNHSTFADNVLLANAAKLAIVIICLVPDESLARGPSYFPPCKLETASTNGQFVAEVTPAGQYLDFDSEKMKFVTPAKERKEPLLQMFRAEQGERKLLWEIELSNDRSPSTVFVANDGRHVVTIGNWGPHQGNRESVLAFYDDEGELKSYSLEEMLSVPTAEIRKFLSGLFPPSWAYPSIKSIRSFGDEQFFCIWYGRENRWLIWRLSNGERVAANESMRERCSQEARKWALTEIASGKTSERHSSTSTSGEEIPHIAFRPTAYEFITALGKPEDRPLLEHLLTTGAFNTDQHGYLTYSSHHGGPFVKNIPETYFVASSDMRQAADRMLAQWDGIATEPNDARWAGLASRSKEYSFRYLGHVHGKIGLVTHPGPASGSLWLYLIPDSIPLDRWHDSPPVHRMRMEFSEYKWGEQVGNQVAFRFKGVTPGKYWVKIVWDRCPPFPSLRGFAVPSHGDYQSTERVEIIVEAGKTLKNVELACTTIQLEAE